MNKNIIITGAAGLIGSRFCDWVLENKSNYNIIGIDDLSGGYIENIDPRIKFYNRQIGSASIEDIFQKYQPEYVFHYAAYAAECLSPFIRKYNYQNNLVATVDIINNCIKYYVKRLVFTSTMAVYGHGAGGIFEENQIPNPIDPYGVAKYSCEMDIKIAGEQHGLDWCIIRPHNVYGIKQNIWDKYRNVLGIWMFQYLNNQPMTIYGDGLQTRAFSYINDSLEPFWNAATFESASKQIINLGGIQEISINEANKTLINVIGDGATKYLQKRHEVKFAIPSYQKSIDILNFEYKTNLHAGLTEMWNWAKTQPKRNQFEWDQFELDKGIYSYWKTPRQREFEAMHYRQ